jgi:hypothetical protein
MRELLTLLAIVLDLGVTSSCLWIRQEPTRLLTVGPLYSKSTLDSDDIPRALTRRTEKLAMSDLRMQEKRVSTVGPSPRLTTATALVASAAFRDPRSGDASRANRFLRAHVEERNSLVVDQLHDLHLPSLPSHPRRLEDSVTSYLKWCRARKILPSAWSACSCIPQFFFPLRWLEMILLEEPVRRHFGRARECTCPWPVT